jgi:hypothetical protein
MKRFVTDYQIDGARYSGEVDALDFEHAQLICDQRGKGETVAGVLYAKIAAGPSFGNDQADRMLKAFADSDDDEPPDASEFDAGGDDGGSALP